MLCLCFLFPWAGDISGVFSSRNKVVCVWCHTLTVFCCCCCCLSPKACDISGVFSSRNKVVCVWCHTLTVFCCCCCCLSPLTGDIRGVFFQQRQSSACVVSHSVIVSVVWVFFYPQADDISAVCQWQNWMLLFFTQGCSGVCQWQNWMLFFTQGCGGVCQWRNWMCVVAMLLGMPVFISHLMFAPGDEK